MPSASVMVRGRDGVERRAAVDAQPPDRAGARDDGHAGVTPHDRRRTHERRGVGVAVQDERHVAVTTRATARRGCARVWAGIVAEAC